MNVIEKLQEIFRDVFDDEKLTITRETSPDDIEDWDSLSQISIITMAQDAFNIKFGITEILEFTNAGKLIDVISKKTAD